MGPNRSEAAANDYYARIQCNTPKASVWMNAPTFTVTGGSKLYVNCFFRSSMTNIKISVSEYDSTWRVLPKSSGPAYTPSGWSWNNYLGRVGSWSTQLNASTYYVMVSVVAAALPAPLLSGRRRNLRLDALIS
jgi:hypothetical protein